MSSPSAFDLLAVNYDDTFTRTPIGRYLRDRVHRRLDRHFSPGNHVLELGCGTGEDALYLAGRGVAVTATDVSPAMLNITREKTRGNPLIRVEQIDLNELPSPHTETGQERFDGVYSNFGPLNCVVDRRNVAAWLATRVMPGGKALFGVMSPLCLWELAWHGLHLDFRTATRRLRRGTVFQPEGVSRPLEIFYPTIRSMTRDFAPWFRRIHVEGIGVFLPPSDVLAAVEKRPRLLGVLTAVETRFSRSPWLALFADHYWIEFERVEA